MNKKDKIKGSLMGGAIGDALGYPIEFKRHVQDKEHTKYDHIGIISDDTQMTLFTANGILWRETCLALGKTAPSIPDAIYLAYKDWYDTQLNGYYNNKISWIKDIDELNVQRAPGNTCLSALTFDYKGTIDKPLNKSKGCGSIMRIAPIGLYVNNSLDAGKIGAEVSALTHGHPLGIIPAYVCSTLINILANSNLSIEEALSKAMQQYQEQFNIFENEYHNSFINLINKAINLSHSLLIDTEAIKELGEGWVADEAFAIAIYSCLKYSNSFEDAVICAINHDGDSDSTGAIAGNIIGASLGYEKIPPYYIDNIELKDLILEIANDLSIEEIDTNDEEWINKYVNCEKKNIKKKQVKTKKNSIYDFISLYLDE